MFQQQKGKRFLETIPVILPPAKFLHSDKTSVGIGKHFIALVASLVLGLALGACSATEVAEPTPTETQAPTATTVPTPAPTPTPTPTPEPVWSWYWNINALAVDPSRTLWIGTPLGLQSFNGETWTTYPEVGLYVSKVEIGPEGEVWAVAERGLWRLEGGEWRNFEPGIAPGLPEGNADQIAISADGMVYVGINDIREGGVAVYDGNRWKTLGSKEDGIFRYIDALVAGPQVGLLVASQGAKKSDLSLMHWDGER